MVIRPTTIGLLCHDESLVFVRSHWILTHGVGKDLGVLPHIRIGQVIVAVVLERERSFSLTVGQVLETMNAYHLHLTIAKLHGFPWVVICQFFHVVLELGTTAIAPEDVGVAIGGKEHARVDAEDAFDGLRLRNEWALGTVCYSHTHGKTASFSRSRREIEIVLPVSVNAVGRPHRIGVRSHPRNFVLSDNHSVIRPIGQILRREHMVVLHAKPVLTLTLGRINVVRGVQIHLSIEHTRSRVGRKLIADNGILRYSCQHKRRET